MTARKSIGHHTRTMKIVKHAITVGAVVLTSVGAIGLNDGNARAATTTPVMRAIPTQIIDEARCMLSPLATLLGQTSQHAQSCSREASARH